MSPPVEASKTVRIALTVMLAFAAGYILSSAFGPGYLVDPLLSAMGEPPRDVLEPLTTRFRLAASLANLGPLMIASTMMAIGSAYLGPLGLAATSKDARRMAIALGLGFATYSVGMRVIALWLGISNYRHWSDPGPVIIPWRDYLALIQASPVEFILAMGTSVMIALYFATASAHSTKLAAVGSVFAVAAAMNLMDVWLGPWPATAGLVAVAALLLGYVATRPKTLSSPAP